jgi:hypothetical protein
MIKLRFSKLPQHRTFNYIPVYYNKEREELHARVNDIKREMGELETTEDSVKDNIRKAYHSKFADVRYQNAQASRFYNLKIVGLVVLLTLISYKLWNSNFIEVILINLDK